MRAPWPVIMVSALISSSLLGDQALYTILPAAYPSLGLTPISVGLLLSVNRWVRLFTNVPAAWLLGTQPIRTVFCAVLVLGASCSFAYASTTNLALLLLARAAWGSSWSIIRLTGLVTLTDACEAGLASEASLGHLSGVHSGLSRIGSLVGLGLGGIGHDVLGFQAFFALVGCLSLAASPFALGCAFGTLPRYSHTAVRRLEQLEQDRLERIKRRARAPRTAATCTCTPGCLTARLPLCEGAYARCTSMSAIEWRLAFLAFASTCAGQGMVMATLAVLLAPAEATRIPTGASGGGSPHPIGGSDTPHVAVVNLGAFGEAIPLASATGVILALRWVFEIGAAPVFGRLIDAVGQRVVCPAFFALCALNGAVGFGMLRHFEAAAEATSMLPLAFSVVCFFVFVSGADLSVNAQGVAQRQTTVLVIGSDLGAAVGPMLGYAILQLQMPPSSILFTQAMLHAVAACVGCCDPAGGSASGGRLRLGEDGSAAEGEDHGEDVCSTRALPEVEET